LQQTSVRPSTRSYTRFSLAMGRSPGFGSTASNSCSREQRPFRLGFPPGPGVTPLPWLDTVTRRFILQKARHYPARRQQALTVCRHTVSGSVSLPSAGCFSPFPHGTVHYRSSAVFSLGGWSPLLPTGLRVSRSTPGSQAEPHHFPLQDSHLLRSPLPAAFG
jgi:hypothetical protein